MRSTTQSGYYIQYPDPIIWLYDINKIQIRGTNAGFNTKIQIQNPDGETSQLEYTTRTKSIMFVLDDNLKWLWEKGNGDWAFTISIDDTPVFSFSSKVLNGKSFLNKTHGSSNVIYHYNVSTVYDPRTIEVYSPNDGRLVVGNTSYAVNFGWNTVYLPSIDIINTGDYNILLTNRNADSITAMVTSDKGIKPNISELTWAYQIHSDGVTIDGGTLYQGRQIFPTTLKLHFLDPCEGDVVLRYTNCDGCIRQISGKLLEVTDEFKPTRLSNVVRSEMYKFNPTFTNNSNSKTIKIGLYEVEAGAEINDIIFSDTLQILDINNEWTDCVLKTNTVTNYKNGDFDNLEFEIYISEL